jgi:hypothetical protein
MIFFYIILFIFIIIIFFAVICTQLSVLRSAIYASSMGQPNK